MFQVKKKTTTNLLMRGTNSNVAMRQGEAQISATYFNETLRGGLPGESAMFNHTTSNLPHSEMQQVHPNDQFGISHNGPGQFATT